MNMKHQIRDKTTTRAAQQFAKKKLCLAIEALPMMHTCLRICGAARVIL